MQQHGAADPAVRPRPAAASTRLCALLEGPVRSLRPRATTTALHLETGDIDVPVVTLTSPRGLRLPASLQLADGGVPRDAGAARIGDGALQIGASRIRVTRWWRPPRPVVTAADAAAARARALLAGLPPLEPAVAAAMRHVDRPDELADLVGLGGGLTPAADDVLTGLLLGLRALQRGGEAAAGRLADRVASRLDTTRTTALSAALLSDADRGCCVPELADLVTMLDGRPAPVDTRTRLLTLGHSSGAALARGAAMALLTATRQGRTEWWE